MSQSRFMQLIPYAATERQREVLRALDEHGTQAKAGDALNVSGGTIASALRKVEAHASRRDFAPEYGREVPLPPTEFLKGASTLYGPDGKVKLRWQKSANVRTYEAIEEISAAFTQDLEPAKRLTHALHPGSDDIMQLYIIGDAHIGALSWAPETGHDFDLKIAKKRILDVHGRLVQRVSKSAAKTAWILNVGDFFHVDGRLNQTPAGGNPLDADSRWRKMMHVGTTIMISMIEAARRVHEVVKVTQVPGNHDPHLAQFLAMHLAAYYRNEDCVHVDISPAPHFFHRFGACLFGTTHKPKSPARMLEAMQTKRLADMSECRWKYWHVGHVHHKVKEVGGCVVESHNVLGPPDAWHDENMFYAQRYAETITYHRDKGEFARYREIPEDE